MEPFEQIMQADLPEVEKLARAYRWISGQAAAAAGHEIERLRALGDREALVKEQVKLNTLQYAQGMLDFCYTRLTGKKAGDE